ncbi:hypothetical protein 2 [Hubei tombus-like virus 1]|uniref:hypothetical protein 2 n=1 Tax=Hubei tombus-like virus 1 TaxID=1923255 RepID=UPI00090A1A56|nr:hypothetical protein 2 [Hubei tombus-like virus 1]APG76356.1 hypothetical protein 3 [Hubei tombus-like virus 1]APG76570.1 hypothetical protein 2 [Hubei tombus-like virus 1]
MPYVTMYSPVVVAGSNTHHFHHRSTRFYFSQLHSTHSLWPRQRISRNQDNANRRATARMWSSVPRLRRVPEEPPRILAQDRPSCFSTSGKAPSAATCCQPTFHGFRESPQASRGGASTTSRSGTSPECPPRRTEQ